MPDGYQQRPRRPALGGRPGMSQRDMGLTRQFLGPGTAPKRRPTGPAGPISPMYSSPANFSQTPAGRAILQRVLQQYAGRRGMGGRRPVR